MKATRVKALAPGEPSEGAPSGPPLSPLVRRVRARILKELASGNHPVAEPVPPQLEWARRFGVSGFTVQRAFEALKREGIVEAQKGSHTFLRRLPPREPSASSTREKTRVSVWLAEPKDMRWMRKSLLRQLFTRRFLAEHPDTQIENLPFELPVGLLETRLVSSILERQEPTTAQLRRTALPLLIEHDVLAAIVEPPGSDSYLEQLNPRWLGACTANGALRMLPSSVSCSFLFYNKELFRKAGLSPDHPPRDWGEFLAAARALKAVTGGQPSFHLGGDPHFIWWLMQLVYQAMPLADHTTAGRNVGSLPPVDWLSDAARQAVDFFCRLHADEHSIHIHHTNLASLCSQCLKNQVPMMMGDSVVASLVAHLNQAHRFGIAPLPVGPNGRLVSMLNCAGWVLNAHASPEQQAAAARYILGRERFVHRGNGGTEMKSLGGCPGLISVLRTPAADTFVVSPLPRDWMERLEHLNAVGQWEPKDADWRKDLLASAVPACMDSAAASDPEHVQHNLVLSEASEGGVEALTTPIA